MTMRMELVEPVGERYRSAEKQREGRVLDEFVAMTRRVRPRSHLVNRRGILALTHF